MVVGLPHRLNPKIRGRVNYYAKFNKHIAYDVFYYLNKLIVKWLNSSIKYVVRLGCMINIKPCNQLIQICSITGDWE